jgi:pantothenate kinase type III
VLRASIILNLSLGIGTTHTFTMNAAKKSPSLTRAGSARQNSANIIAVDCGNSRVKISDGHVVMSVDGSKDLTRFFAHRPDYVVAWSSVQPATWNTIKKMCSKHRTIDVLKAVHTHSPLRAVKAVGAGSDRVLGCAGALFLRGNGTCITIDCGTATTINIVNARREFIGGMIFPGLRLMAQSLNEHTAQLPNVAFDEPAHRMDTTPGANTTAAIRSGLLHATAGGIVSAVHAAHKQLRTTDIPVYITGGNAAILLPILKPQLSFQHVPDLVLDAIRRIAMEVMKEEGLEETKAS